jgi:diguanylate cyclase (GGDEF)-like protein/PAS domain S-box-containing protein
MLDTHRDSPTSAPQSSALEVASRRGKATHPAPLRWLWWAAFVLLGLATGAVGWTIWQLRNDAVRATTADAGNIASVLASQLARSLYSIDAVLLEIKRSGRNIDNPSKLRAAFGREESHDLLKEHLVQLPNLFNIAIADENGQLVVSTAAWPTPDINIADRDYFKTARTRVDGQLTISVPFRNRIDDTLTIVFARRLETSSGNFSGIVFASANFRYFEHIYQSTESIQSAIFTLVRRDGIILYRHPDTQGFVGRKLSGYAIFDDAVTSGAKGFQLLAKADGVIRYISLRQVSDYPLFVNISVAQGVALAGWLRQSIAIGLGSATLLLCSIFLLIAISRQVRRLSASEAALRESKNVIGAMLDAVPARIFWKDKNLVYLGCNAPFARDAGFADPEDIVGKDDHQMGWRDQAELYQAADREVIQTGRSKLLIKEPQTTPEGAVNTLLTSKVPLHGSNGDVFGVLGTYMDVTERARLEEELSFSNLLKTTAMENSPDAIVVVDENRRIISSNRQFSKLWNIPQELVEEGGNEPVLQALAEQVTDREAFIARIEYLYEHPDEKAHSTLRLKDGRVIDWHTAPLLDARQKYLGRIWYYRDITERELAIATIEKQNLQFDAALNNMAQGLLMFDSAGALIVSNRRFVEMLELPTEQWKASAIGLTVVQIIDLADRLTNVAMKNMSQNVAKLQNILDRRQAGALVFELTNGRTFCASCSPMPDGGFVITLEDTTEQRRTQDQISHMAHYDALTDLPNRAHFYEAIEPLLARGPQSRAFAVLSLDLDRFKSVNDTLGHPIGDKLLQVVAARMRACVREGDIVARLGGDEFAIVQTTFERPEDATSLATRLIDAVSAPYRLDGHQVIVGASIGIAIAPGDGTAPDQLMKNADLALYRCKADHGNVYRFFEAQMDTRMQERRALELDLRNALVNGEFALEYQPIVNLKTGRVTACEALVRWHQPERGLVPPLEFIPIAEETGLIVPIGEWVLERACTDAVEWPDEIAVAVNVSPVQFKTGDFVQVVTSALEKSRMPAHRLELEITELVLMHESNEALALLHKLKNLGVSIAMDDFGTGYSSLGYLRSFPFDRIKIDQSFIRELPLSKESLAILRAVVGLGSSLDIITTAEGVETKNQLEILRAEGCTDVQGFFFSPPKGATEIKSLLGSLSEHEVAVA